MSSVKTVKSPAPQPKARNARPAPRTLNRQVAQWYAPILTVLGIVLCLLAMAGVLYFGPNGASSRMAGIEEKVEALGKALVIERTRNRDLSIRFEEIEARVAAEPATEPSANSSLNQ